MGIEIAACVPVTPISSSCGGKLLSGEFRRCRDPHSTRPGGEWLSDVQLEQDMAEADSGSWFAQECLSRLLCACTLPGRDSSWAQADFNEDFAEQGRSEGTVAPESGYTG